MAKTIDLVIIGAGPAGVAAAIQANIYGLKTLVMEKDAVGGRLKLARRVDNFLSPDRGRGRSGGFWARAMEKRLAADGIPIVRSEAAAIFWRNDRFVLYDRQGRSYNSAAVILATGTRPRSWRVSIETGAEERIHPHWRSVPQTDGREVAVIGGGETAFDQACSLSEHGARVWIFIRGQRPKAHPGLIQEAGALGIKIVVNCEIVQVSKSAGGLWMMDNRGRRWKCQAVVPSIGWQEHRPQMDEAASRRKGWGLYLAGDVAEKRFRQAAVAFGSGLAAAMSAREYLGGRR